jgi:NAD(P)-dependent dehydrogenase (short-subunit alcohol dehydrogenase family)
MRSVVITGASTGIGYASAAELGRRGWRVFGSVRSAADSERLQRELGPGFTPLQFDVTDADAVRAAAAKVKQALGTDGLDALVNNAGISDPGPLSVQSPDIVRRHLEVNVIGVVHTVQAFVPLLRRAKGSGRAPGRIVNMSSVSGRIAYPFMGAYAASKHALEGLSDSLRRELMVYGIDVVVIEPASIDTPIWDKAQHIRTAFQGSDYAPLFAHVDLAQNRKTALPVSTVTRRVVQALESRRPKARYLVPDRYFMYWVLPRLLPDRWLDRIIDRMLNLKSVRDSLK